MRTNAKAKTEVPYTYEGARAVMHLSIEQKLRRSIMACMLWEDTFYEDGESITDRIKSLCLMLTADKIASLAIEVRNEHHMRHVSLWLLVALIERGRGNPIVSKTIPEVIQRADELAELVALYWKDGKKPLSAQMKKGLAAAFVKFDAYALAKYDRGDEIKLRDVMFLCRPKPKNNEQAEVFKKLANQTLESPDTWEVALSGGADKKETFTRLIQEKKLGYLALLRNLRNMVESGVDADLVRSAIRDTSKARDILPFRYIAAARAAPVYEAELDLAMMASIEELPVLSGLTVIMMDVSGSMNEMLSQKSDMLRMDAGAALAAIIRSDELRIFTFSNGLVEVPANRRGMSCVDVIRNSQRHAGTHLHSALTGLYSFVPTMTRLIVISDEQIAAESGDALPAPENAIPYMINVGTNKNGVGYGKWMHIDGFSENIIKYIHQTETESVED